MIRNDHPLFLSCYSQQACMPKAVAMAVSTVIVILEILLQMFLFSVSRVVVSPQIIQISTD